MILLFLNYLYTSEYLYVGSIVLFFISIIYSKYEGRYVGI